LFTTLQAIIRIHPQPEKGQHLTTSWKRVLVALLAVFAVIGVAGGIYAYLSPWIIARSFLQSAPALDLVPTLLPDTTIAQLAGPRIESGGISLQLPWNPPNRDVSSGVISLPQKEALSISGVKFAENRANLIRGLAGSKGDALRQALGDRTLRSNYDLMRTELAASSAQAKWWKSRSANTTAMVLLAFKNTHVVSAEFLGRYGLREDCVIHWSLRERMFRSSKQCPQSPDYPPHKQNGDHN
jgi:hypothetical protein